MADILYNHHPYSYYKISGFYLVIDCADYSKETFEIVYIYIYIYTHIMFLWDTERGEVNMDLRVDQSNNIYTHTYKASSK